MLKKRIIACLDIKDGRTVKGINFESIRDAGDPIELAKRYVDQGVDELVFLDISATIEKRKTLIKLVSQIAAEINIPFTVGGGIKSLRDAQNVIEAGADKISINSAAVSNLNLITGIANYYGSQCVVLAIDSKNTRQLDRVFVNGGKKETSWTTLDWAKKGQELGAGEILLTSMDHDGTKSGFALSLYRQIDEALTIPIIASGGAGNMEDFKELFSQTNISAGLAASIFHYHESSILEIKKYLANYKIPMR